MVAIRMDASAPRIQTLRISITSQSNIKPFYATSLGLDSTWTMRPPTLLHTDINKFVKIVGEQGVTRVEICGNEPLLRKDVSSFIKAAHAYKGIKDVRVITNGTQLKNYADGLRKMGLKKVEIEQCDTLDFKKYQKITGKDALYRVLDGIEKVEKLKYSEIVVNILLLNQINNDELVEMARWTRDRKIHIRFKEFAPVQDRNNPYEDRPILTVRQAKDIIENYQKLEMEYDLDQDQPTPTFRFEGGVGKISFVSAKDIQAEREKPCLYINEEGVVYNNVQPKKTLSVLSSLRKDSKDPKFRKSIEKFIVLKKPSSGKKAKTSSKSGRKKASSQAKTSTRKTASTRSKSKRATASASN
jgi:cyclic pyranopterin phosphate synthase